jgi:hypothetical protein
MNSAIHNIIEPSLTRQGIVCRVNKSSEGGFYTTPMVLHKYLMWPLTDSSKMLKYDKEFQKFIITVSILISLDAHDILLQKREMDSTQFYHLNNTVRNAKLTLLINYIS